MLIVNKALDRNYKSRRRLLRMRERTWETISALKPISGIIAVILAILFLVSLFPAPCETIGECQEARITKALSDALEKPLPPFK